MTILDILAKIIDALPESTEKDDLLTEISFLANEKFIDLPAVVTQSLTDIYAGSANGMGSFKESRLQLLNFMRDNITSTAGTTILNADQDYLLDSPLPKLIVASIPTPGHTIKLPDPTVAPAVLDGAFFEISGDPTAQAAQVLSHLGNVIIPLNPGQTYFFWYTTQTDLLPFSIDGWIPQTSVTNQVVTAWDGSSTQVEVTAGSNIDITDGVISAAAGGDSGQFVQTIEAVSGITSAAPLKARYTINQTTPGHEVLVVCSGTFVANDTNVVFRPSNPFSHEFQTTGQADGICTIYKTSTPVDMNCSYEIDTSSGNDGVDIKAILFATGEHAWNAVYSYTIPALLDE